MQVTLKVSGLSKMIARFEKSKQQTRAIPVGEVYVQGERADVAAMHVTGTDRMPARNPFFLDRSQTVAVRRRIEQGVREVNDGLSSGMRQTMSDAARIGADAMRDNMDRQRHSPWGAATATPGRMARLSKPYAKWKQARYGAQPILQATGELRASIASRIKEG